MEVTSCNVRTPQPRVGNKNLGAHKRGTTTSDTEDGETEIPPEGEVQGSRANKENTIVIKKTGSGGGLQGNINRDEDEDEQRRPQRAGKQVVEDEENEDEDDEEEEPPQPQPRKKVNQQKVAKTRKKKLHIPDDDYVIPIQRNAQTLGLPPYGGKVLIGYEESWEKRIYETPDHRGDECQILYIFIPFCWHFNSSFVH
ncbi:nucleolin-like isoform X3 [Papaver somniferum]|nr:nucleolin-like isoform X3 [Papaver somniferum]